MKRIAILLIALMVISVGFLSGCNESTENTTRDTDKVELVNYSVVTEWSTGYFIGGTYKEFQQPDFYHGVPENATKYGAYYFIKGTIRNIASKIVTVRVTGKFYDKDNNLLKELVDPMSAVVRDLPSNYTGSFSFKYYKEYDYFYNVDHVEFEFLVS